MKKKLRIETANLEKNQLLLSADQPVSGLVPAGQMLVDSDGFAFIYLMEENGDYTYIVLMENIWPSLKTALDQKAAVILSDGTQKIELLNLFEELEYLIGNIKGNSNYGEEMVTKVEAVF